MLISAKPGSFDSCKEWLRDLREQSENVSVLLIGNKSDLRNLREVPSDIARRFSEENDLTFIETSALDNSNVEKAFTLVLTKIYRSGMANIHKNEDKVLQLSANASQASQAVPKNGCCRSG
ncbi:unnamed protein product [Strongylus vulgaris]|uniref:Uncharacterized protein n=1 Tax=Strongylus vulgaris TaxID=40348 RepID=A0A3P7KN14_STRVU|nr:unnamed protein product [Strongylus vulgaris]